jgi:hypothetical protein
MPSPDFTEYVDLTIYDIDAFQVYDDAIEYARIAVPEFAPRAGTLEEAIMQAISYNTALLSSQINRLPDGLMEGMLRVVGLERREATFATGTVVFEVFDDNGVTIPLGTIVSYEITDDDVVSSFLFETVSDLVIPEGFTTGEVNVVALNAGKYPALLAGQILELVSPAPSVVSVELVLATTVGSETEADGDYFNRAAQYFASLSGALTTKTQIYNYIKANYPNIGALGVFDLTNAEGSLSFDDPSEPGYVTIVATGLNGEEFDANIYDSLTNDIRSKSVAGLNITAIPVTNVPLLVNVTVVLANGFNGVEVRQAVDDYLTEKLSVSKYDFSGKIVKNELISGVANIDGVAYVSMLEILIFDHPYLTQDTEGNVSVLLKNAAVSGMAEVLSS